MLLEIEGVSKHYPAPPDGRPLEVLRDVSLSLDSGESLAITGPSGSGKSTLLNIAAALERPSRGRVLLAGRDLAGLKDDERARVRAERLGLVFQLHHLLPQCTALENCLVPTLALERGRPSAATHDRARRLLERVGLGARLHHRPDALSGGECQRVAVARALMNQPALLLADEPTGALDGATASELVDLLCEINCEERLALLVVTHSHALASRMAGVRVLVKGRLEGPARPVARPVALEPRPQRARV